MRTLAIANQKGGSGKTTTAVNLAAALGERDRRVLLVDLDPQASASTWLGVKDGGKAFLDVIVHDGHIADIVVPTDVPGVDLVPSSVRLAGAEQAICARPAAKMVLRRILRDLPTDRWDYVLIDCPPAF